MKVVINKCYGGYGLSKRALLELHRRGSAAVAAVSPKNYFGRDRNDEYVAMRMRERDLVVVDGKIIVYNDDDSARSDKILVEVVEELGAAANGDCADLGIVEIPDGICFEIEDYDGRERINETHRSWS